MSEAKHFPAPWRAGERDEASREIPILCDHPRTGGTYTVAVVLPCSAGVVGRDVMPGMTAAHAALIASAPDLLAACEAAMKLGTQAFGVKSILRAAVAKAKGGAE